MCICVPFLNREMFITGYEGIFRAYMDGTNFMAIVTGFYAAKKVILDDDSDRLYWTTSSSIASSFMNGTGIEYVVYVGFDTEPYGLAKLGDMLYWSDRDAGKLQRSTITGEDVVTLYNNTNTRIQHLALIPSQDSPDEFRRVNVSNPCKGQGCSHICVLRGKSFRCLCPDGLRLAHDQRTCVEGPDMN